MNKTDYCKKCKKRYFDPAQGIVCSITNQKPTFENNCIYFERDETVREYEVKALRHNEQRAKLAQILLWVVLGMRIMALVSGILQYNLLNTVANGGVISNSEAVVNDLREQIIAILYLAAFVFSAITFIMWFRRAYFNLHQKITNLSFAEGWAAGCWFVPIVNLYRPYQIMKELYEDTKTYIQKKNNSIQIELTTKLLGIWWTLWIINGIIGNVIFRLSRNADTIQELLTTTMLDIISSSISIPLALITIKIIKDYSKVEDVLILKEK